LYDLAPPPPLSPCCEHVVSLSQSSCESPVELTDERGGGGSGGGAKPYDHEKGVPYKSFNTFWSAQLVQFNNLQYPLRLSCKSEAQFLE
jgi:hypothetical protein